MSRLYRYEYTDWVGLGKRMRIARESIGLTREKFSEMINRTENYVLSLEKGDKSCSIHTLYQISCVLRKSCDYLMFGEDMEIEEHNKYTSKEILNNIIERCDDEELQILQDIIIATFPNLKVIKSKKTK